jgi:sec-independent protein translocase protein TatA
MGLDNPLHIAFLLILLLLVFGAKRLPEMGRSLGSGLRGFKDSLSSEHPHDALPAAGHEPERVAVATSGAPAVTPLPAPVALPVREPSAPAA